MLKLTDSPLAVGFSNIAEDKKYHLCEDFHLEPVSHGCHSRLWKGLRYRTDSSTAGLNIVEKVFFFHI